MSNWRVKKSTEASAKWIAQLEEKYKTLTVLDKEYYNTISIKNTFLRVACSCSEHPEYPFKRTYININKNGCPICRTINRVKEIAEEKKDNVDGFKLSLNMAKIASEYDKDKAYSIHIDCECSKCKHVFTLPSSRVLACGTGNYPLRMKCPNCNFMSDKPINEKPKDEKESFIDKEVLNDILVEFEVVRSVLSEEINNLPYDVYSRLSIALCRPQGMLKSLIKEI